jgi:uncharacterized protein (TIGR02270 family)
VLFQHIEEAAALRSTRTHLVSAPQVDRVHLGRWDERLAAHLDGIAVAGDFGAQLADAALESPGTGEVFVAAVGAIQAGDSERLDRLFSLAEASLGAQAGLISAFGWVSAPSLKGIVSELLRAKALFRKRVGIAACALHRVDPGQVLGAAISSPDVPLRARSLRCAGEVGRLDSLPACLTHLRDEDATCAFWAAWSAVLLGDRGEALDSLKRLCTSLGPHQHRAARIVLKTLPSEDAHALMATLAPNPTHGRVLVQATGVAGDPFYVSWLIEQMGIEKLARLAGESFSLITGLDLSRPEFERPAPEGVETGPTASPDDENVSMDPDDGLPWPDPEKIKRWWAANGQRFEPRVRHFMGKPPTWEHCLHVLKTGYQRQRIAAAEYLCLLRPGTPLFNTSAPAWRQQRLLDKIA